ncbi:hypothetical protein CPB84DRAFT_1822614 [Gymnopilus junonius]|uniref:Uncharacterized protein n=1 Tax=Gymnopilus junonius TaxID=109634 RepID=A0A9P5NWL8_GYMJU|nr:hypothetical protein CPB84DRAFT_1822614 [Gymnopilus junonius]
MKARKGLCQLLIKESLVDEKLILDLRKLSMPRGGPNLHYKLDQPFIIDLEYPAFTDLCRSVQDITFYLRKLKATFLELRRRQYALYRLYPRSLRYLVSNPRSRVWCSEFWTCCHLFGVLILRMTSCSHLCWGVFL